MKGELKQRLTTYFRQHSDVGSGALKKRDAYIKSLEDETLFRYVKDYRQDQANKKERRKIKEQEYNEKLIVENSKRNHIHTLRDLKLTPGREEENTGKLASFI